MRADGPPRLTAHYPWRVFWVLLAAGVLSAVGAMPYVLALFGDKLSSTGSRANLPLLTFTYALQMTLVLGVFVGIGLVLGRKVGIGTPLLARWLYRTPADARRSGFALSVVAAVFLGGVSAVVFYRYLPARVPEWPGVTGAVWMRVLAAVYSGIDEELLMRLFLLSLVLWLLQKIARRGPGTALTAPVFWIGNVIVALIFSAAYLPTLSVLVPLSQLVVTSVISTKTIAGLVFGYLCWSRGLEAAMLAHFVTDLAMHLLGPMLAG